MTHIIALALKTHWHITKMIDTSSFSKEYLLWLDGEEECENFEKIFGKWRMQRSLSTSNSVLVDGRTLLGQSLGGQELAGGRCCYFEVLKLMKISSQENMLLGQCWVPAASSEYCRWPVSAQLWNQQAISPSLRHSFIYSFIFLWCTETAA